MAKTAKEMLESPDFKRLARKRRTLSLVLLVMVVFIYYGYILLVAYNREFMVQKIGEATTMGIPISVLVIVLLWGITGIYVLWANKGYDHEVKRLKEKM
jgi:uncharacterized membrane protein (DUF485 family)